MPATSTSSNPLAPIAVKLVEAVITLFIEETLPNGDEVWVVKNPYSPSQLNRAVTEFLDQFFRLDYIDGYTIESLISEPEGILISLIIKKNKSVATFEIRESFEDEDEKPTKSSKA